MTKCIGKHNGVRVYQDDQGGLTFGCIDVIILAETITAEPETIEAPAETTPPKDDTKPAEKETPEDIEKRGRKPPADGPCKGCGENKPLNRLMLCYKCWLYKRLNDADPSWLPGDPHPKTCGCDGPGGCSTKNQGN